MKKVQIKKSIMSLLLVLVCSITSYAQENHDERQILAIDDSTFSCMRDMTKVDGFYVGNLLGNVKETIEIASSASGGVYPPGSVVQLVPTEVMVKHQQGHSPATNDWEFFELNVSTKGTEIINRGFIDVVNRFGGNCLGCHAKAEAKWDMICKTGHGCDPIPLTKDVLALLQKTDPRCKNNEQLNETEIKTLMQLKKTMAALLSVKDKP